MLKIIKFGNSIIDGIIITLLNIIIKRGGNIKKYITIGAVSLILLIASILIICHFVNKNKEEHCGCSDASEICHCSDDCRCEHCKSKN